MSRKTATEKYMEREKKAIYTTTVDTPVLKKGKGVWVEDVGGKMYLDFTSQISLLNTGYCPSKIVRVIKHSAEQVHSCISADWPFCFEFEGMEISRAALAEKLIEISNSIMPFEKKVMFEVSGATAVNAALKIAKISYLRKKGKLNNEIPEKHCLHSNVFMASYHDNFRFSFLTSYNAFAGRHGDAQCITNSKAVQLCGASSSCAFGRLPLPYPGQSEKEIHRRAYGLIKQLSNYAPVIAFIFEPIQGEGGINVPSKKGLRILANYLREKGIYIIADEIQSGLGRTGKMFACKHFDIQPDMVILSKSLAAGLPMGAVIANADKFPDLEPGMHSGSMHCTPSACAAAVTNLEMIEKHLENAAKLGRYAINRLKLIAKKHFAIKEIRGLGLMLGIEFHQLKTREVVLKQVKNLGLLLAPCGEKTIRFYPPIIVSKRELDLGLDTLEGVLENL
jgi:4-aminobutyrate aminotransferase